MLSIKLCCKGSAVLTQVAVEYAEPVFFLGHPESGQGAL